MSIKNFVRVTIAGSGALAGIALAVAALQLSSADPTPQVEREPDPCEGQTDEACNETIDKLRSEFNARYVEWINDYLASDQDVRELRRARSNALGDPPLPTLGLAVDSADAIVLGTVTDVAFEVVPPDDPSGFAFVQSTARVAIDETFKGGVAKEIEINQYGGPEPNSDWKTGHLLYTEAAPLLLDGDKVLLFLDKDEFGYLVQSWTGTYLIDSDGKLDAVFGNPFEASAEADSVTQFSTAIEASVAEQAAAQ